ncbi:lysosomal thioesterase PPT2 [Hippocampus comes]|uniref:lysosomal thioesterase PPT2 n=1 Tax=Hippocampus comes TaxID=109280 RepID=UPI00094E8623|nr:PREDICTED: lysosomal thioesterase PPT2-A-like [Hippocampus comes]
MMKGFVTDSIIGKRESNGGAARLLWPLLGACLWAAAVAFKPVIIVHGLFDSSGDFKNLQRFINESHPGTNVTVIDLFDRGSSLQPMWKQVEGFKAAIYPIMQNSAEGVHFICYSQGGLICRGILSTLPNHNVHSFISLSSPQAGRCLFLSPDPHHRDMYTNSSDYLALLNSDRPNPNSTEWKKNFLRLNKLVLVGGPDDGVITPWQSSQFGFFDDNETVVEMQRQGVYLKDIFGLKTLAARGDLILCSVPYVQHVWWHSNETVFHTCMEKWLV